MLKLCYTGVSFDEAITQLQAEGDDEAYIRIEGKWSEDVKVKIQWPDKNSKMTAPYLYVTSRFGKVPWIPTQIEMLSEVYDVYCNVGGN